MLHLSNFTFIDTSAPNRNFLDWRSRDTDHISINYKYISTDIDLDKDTFKSAIEKRITSTMNVGLSALSRCTTIFYSIANVSH